MNAITRRAAFAAPLALAPLPALASAADPAPRGGLDCAAIRRRVTEAAEVYEVDPAPFLRLTDLEITDGEDGIRWVMDNLRGVSFDWLFAGDARSMLRAEKALRGGDDPAVAAFDDWRAAQMRCYAACEAPGSPMLTDEEVGVFVADASEALYRLAETTPTTPEGAARMMRAAFYAVLPVTVTMPADPLALALDDYPEEAPIDDAAHSALWAAMEAMETLAGVKA